MKLVYARWYHLPHVPFRLLCYMALVSRDDDDPPTFWGGREALAFAFGRIIDPATPRAERETVFRLVRKATTTLVKRGAITVTETARPGRCATYALHLAESMTDPQGPPMEAPQVPEWRTLRYRMEDPQVPPEDIQEEGGRIAGLSGYSSAEAAPVRARDPESVNEDQLQQRRYDRATAELQRLPDLGATYMAQAQTDLGGDTPLRDLVIHAAYLAGMDAA